MLAVGDYSGRRVGLTHLPAGLWAPETEPRRVSLSGLFFARSIGFLARHEDNQMQKRRLSEEQIALALRQS